MRRQTDDQEARARYAAESGVGLGVSGPAAADLESQLDALLDDSRREGMKSALREQRPENGAAAAAEWLTGLAGSERVRKPGSKRWKRYAAHPVTSARAAAPFAARVPGALGRIVHQTATRPKARVVIEAKDLSPERVEALLPKAIEDTGVSPERVLVLTSRVDVLPVLRKAGVGGEHVSASGRRELILAERPRIQRFVTLDT
jgi:hypothetical protein